MKYTKEQLIGNSILYQNQEYPIKGFTKYDSWQGNSLERINGMLKDGVWRLKYPININYEIY